MKAKKGNLLSTTSNTASLASKKSGSGMKKSACAGKK